jgi:hypothetical protein
VFPEEREASLTPVFGDSGEECEVGVVEEVDYLSAQFCGEV